MTLALTPSNRRIHVRRDNSSELSVEDLIDQVRLVFRNAGISAAQNKISRLVRTYKHRPEANGFQFADYLINSLALTVMQRRHVRDELARVVAYADPTGELAVDNVLNESKHSPPRKGKTA